MVSPVQLPREPAFGDPLPLARNQAVLDFLARRRSTSALTLEAPGPGPEDLEALLRLAGRVPDHGKLAPWRFVILEGADKTAFADRLEALARDRNDAKAAAKLGKLRTPPLCVAVIFTPQPGEIPQWEQILSAGAVCTNLLYAALAAGYGANWITDWYAFDPEARAILGLDAAEQVAGFILMGQAREAPLERERPALETRTSRWTPPAG